MSALAMAMLLTGAGAVDDAQRRRAPPPPAVLTTGPPAPPRRWNESPPPFPPPPAPPPWAEPARRVRDNLNSYFGADDYPAAARRAREQGRTSVRLAIGADGRVTGCQVTASSGSLALDQATCRILRSRARYAPARDRAGNPMAGSDSGRIAWILRPADPPVDKR